MASHYCGYTGKICIVLIVYGLLVIVQGERNTDLKKRNVLIFVADDLGFETQVYNNTVCKTPNLDALASRSLIIRNAYVAVSSCSPSRAAILTGLPPHQSGQFGLEGSENNFKSYDIVQSLPAILRTGGIKTGIIGKKHIGPDTVYQFDYEKTEKTNGGVLQVGRNVTFMKEKVQEFFNLHGNSQFLLYMGMSDPHRIGGKTGEFGEKWGDGSPGMGIIPDWQPVWYQPEDVIVPPYLPDTPATRADIAAQYTSISRMDAVIGMVMTELTKFGYLDDTLIMFTSDNGIPFPNAKTNLYEPGMGTPMLISSPVDTHRWGLISVAMTSTLDITPTVLDWFQLDYPNYDIVGKKVNLTGRSMLRLVEDEPTVGWDDAYASHVEHEATMYYPMRVLRSKHGGSKMRLIHNLNNRAPYPIAGDIYPSPTYQDLLNRTHQGEPTHWFKELGDYYYRAEFELYDLDNDVLETTNVADDTQFEDVFNEMKDKLKDWQNQTGDPWICYPHGIRYKGGCGSLYNTKPGMKFGFVKDTPHIQDQGSNHKIHKHDKRNKIQNKISNNIL
ncbi:N-sulphoglucosamine sulphohydrolase-like [Amphiura filiformis]|uniref:N-sulphoglucosamine sulphohydrolase-like n=1 Tax=Amphiura filiformis TaxID=82378 RepID=UPI003B22742D